MSPIYTPGKLILRRTYIGLDDPDAAAYITAVEIADGQPLEIEVRVAIHTFVKGCKADGIWPAIKASCIMAGARTLAGALVPLVGPAPTNFNFVAGDYNRKTGLVGNGSNKTIDSGRANNADPQDNNHNAVFVSFNSGTQAMMGGGDSGGVNLISRSTNRNRTGLAIPGSGAGGFQGTNRSASAGFVFRAGGSSTANTLVSVAPSAGNIFIFSRRGVDAFSAHRLAYYSIGESLDLALLDARITTLINRFAVVIP